MGRSTTPRGREAAFAACLALVLAVGVLGVLMLNTVMQQQSDRISRQHQHIAELVQRAQQLETALHWQNDPARLAARAQSLHLHPIKSVDYVKLRRLAAVRAHAG